MEREKAPPTAGFGDLASGLHLPISPFWGPKVRKSPSQCANVPVFGRLQLETSWDQAPEDGSVEGALSPSKATGGDRNALPLPPPFALSKVIRCLCRQLLS
jgi:hypothetical protein